MDGLMSTAQLQPLSSWRPGAVAESVQRGPRVWEIGNLVPSQTNNLSNRYLSFPSLAFGIIKIGQGLVRSVSETGGPISQWGGTIDFQ